MASLYKRGLYWWIRLTDGESILLCLPNRHSTGLRNRRTADQLLKQLQEQLVIKKNESQFLSKVPNKNMLFSDVLQKYIEHKKNEGESLSEKTVEIYDRALKTFFKALPNKLISEYRKEDYYLFLEEMRELSQNTKAIYTGRLNALFSYLVKEDYISKNYFRTVKEEVKKLNILSPEQIAELIEYAKGKRFYNAVMLMYLGAFRATEALSITEANIKENHIEIIGKGNKHASIPIIKEMRDFLNTNPVLTDEYKYIGLRKFFQRASHKLGFEIHSHDLRKYQLSRMANKGVKIYFVKNYARHSDIKTTLKYYAGVDLKEMENDINQKLSQ